MADFIAVYYMLHEKVTCIKKFYKTVKKNDFLLAMLSFGVNKLTIFVCHGRDLNALHDLIATTFFGY